MISDVLHSFGTRVAPVTSYTAARATAAREAVTHADYRPAPKVRVVPANCHPINRQGV